MNDNTKKARELIDRIDAAISRITTGQCTMRIPVDDTDPDIVLLDCKSELTAILAALSEKEQVGQEPVEFDYPDYSYEGMGCGLEDRNITDRYEAMRYGFDEAIDQMARILDGMGPLYTAPQPASAVPDTRSPSYDALLLIVQSVCGALARAGITDCDDPGEAIDVMRESYEAMLASAVPDGLAERIADYLCEQDYDIGGRDELLGHIRAAMLAASKGDA